MKVTVLNGKKVNYDHSIDYQLLSEEVVVFDDTDKTNFIKHVSNSEIIISKEMPIDKEMIEALPDTCKCIIEAGTGYNNIDLTAAKNKGIIVCNTPAYSSKRVAHTAIMHLLNLASSMKKQIRMIQNGDKTNFEDHMVVSHIEVNDKTLGVIGYGNIGKEVIKVAQALGMHILVSSRTQREDTNGIHFVDKETLLKESDFISLHCPLNEHTKHMISTNEFQLMKPTSYIINTSRGALIDEVALIKALKNKEIAGAGLDVHEGEPPIHPELYEMDNVLNTPHMGWRGLETRQRLMKLVKEDIDAYKQGKCINVVN